MISSFDDYLTKYTHMRIKHVMTDQDHVEIGFMLMERLQGKGVESFIKSCGSGSVYVFILNSRQRIRISNHAKHRGWIRYNIRTDLKESREHVVSGQKVYLFASQHLERAANRIARDYNNVKIREASWLVKKRPRRRILKSTFRTGGRYGD